MFDKLKFLMLFVIGIFVLGRGGLRDIELVCWWGEGGGVRDIFLVI